MKVLILGATGMIGSALMCVLSKNNTFDLVGTSTDDKLNKIINIKLKSNLLTVFNFLNNNNLEDLITKVKPDVIINCIGIVKQSSAIDDNISTIYLNSILPHKLSEISLKLNIRLIHLSTDSVFSGKKGFYNEEDDPDPVDFYGRTKLIGEITKNNSLTLRTSLIGHEFFTKNGLLEWFLNQEKECYGYRKAFFSGFTTISFAKIIESILLKQKDLKGLYHISSNIISKYDLLKIISKSYTKNIEILENNAFAVDRSLDSSN